MRFLKENSYDIVRLYINQIGITIFSLVLYFSITSLSNNPDGGALYLKVKIGISIFAILFFYALLYIIITTENLLIIITHIYFCVNQLSPFISVLLHSHRQYPSNARQKEI